MSSAAEEQVLKYASDLARLYAQAEEDRRRLQSLERALVRLAEVSLELMSAFSLADAGYRLARAGREVLGFEGAAVYLNRKDRFVLLAQDAPSTPFAVLPAVTKDDLSSLQGEPELLESPPWGALTADGVPVSIVPLRGRRRAVGFLAGTGQLQELHAPDGSPDAVLLSLLASQAGVVLENHLLEERRSESTSRGVRSSGKRREIPRLLGRSPAMDEVLVLIDRLARVESTVLFTGETGTGKTLLARLLHDSGPRAAGPFVTLNCAAIPEALVESELFGHEAGAFTGALKKHLGRIEQAKGGTLFMDEVGELPRDVQSKLLNFLEDRRYTRVGGERELHADVRLLSATNSDLAAAVEQKTFRSDLLYRLNVFTIELPPLRRRGSDVVLLARSFAREVALQYDLPEPEFPAASEEGLLSYGWPGNVRELRNVIEKAVILSDGGPISSELLPRGPAASQPAGAESGERPPQEEAIDTQLSFGEAKAQMIERWETTYVRALLRSTGGNIARAARLARVDKKNLHRKIKQYGIDVGELR